MKKVTVLYAVAIAAIIVLIIVTALNYLALQSANSELEHYKLQEKSIAKAVVTEHLADIQSARSAWIEAHQAEYMDLQNAGITLEADAVMTEHYTAVLDPSDPFSVIIGPPGDIDPGTVKIELSQYFADNLSSASSWTATYVVNRSTHKVSGLTASLVQTLSYTHYVNNLSGNVETILGVAPGVVVNYNSVTLDTSYIPETDTWVDETEYKFWLKNTELHPYLSVKTYVKGATETVTGYEVSAPYYTSKSPVYH